MPSPLRAKAARHMTRLFKLRVGEKKRPHEGDKLTLQMWLRMCMDRQVIRSPIIQGRGKEGTGE